MPLIPATLPIWAYPAAGAAAFVAAKLASGGIGGTPEAPGDAAAVDPTAAPSGSASDLWDTFGGTDQYGFAPGGSMGTPIGAGGGLSLDPPLGDGLGGGFGSGWGDDDDPGDTTAPPSSAPAPTAAPVTAPPPAPAAKPAAPTVSTITVKAGTYRWYSVSGGKVTSFKTVAVKAFSANVDRYATYPWPAEKSQRILVRITSGAHSGLYFSPAQAGVSFSR